MLYVVSVLYWHGLYVVLVLPWCGVTQLWWVVLRAAVVSSGLV